jgi:signal transduction histidine kinase
MAHAQAADAPLATSIRTVFRVDPTTRTVARSGEPIDSAMDQSLLAIADSARRALPANAYFGMVWPPTARGPVVIYDLLRDSSAAGGNGIYGFLVPEVQLGELLDQITGNRRLLPRRVATRLAGDSTVGFRLAVAGRSLVDRGFDPRSPYQSTADLGPVFGNLVATVSLEPATAARLVAGGLPRYRAPALAGFLGLAIASLVLLGIVVRREHRLQDLREQFVAGVSHELRTPLAQLRLFSETLALGRVRSEEERIRSLEIIGKETERLSHLVENLLTFSRLERGSASLVIEPVDLGELMTRLLDEFTPLLAPGMSLSRRIDPDVRVRADAGAIRQIGLNLLDNAVKFGPPGQTIAVSVRKAAAGAELEVADEGPGVPADQRDLLWRRFWRGPIAAERGIGGTGIGLSIVADLVRAHGGAVQVTDRPPSGSRFVVFFPADGAPA